MPQTLHSHTLTGEREKQETLKLNRMILEVNQKSKDEHNYIMYMLTRTEPANQMIKITEDLQ